MKHRAVMSCTMNGLNWVIISSNNFFIITMFCILQFKFLPYHDKYKCQRNSNILILLLMIESKKIQKIRNFNELDDVEKFLLLISSEDKQIVTWTGKFICGGTKLSVLYHLYLHKRYYCLCLFYHVTLTEISWMSWWVLCRRWLHYALSGVTTRGAAGGGRVGMWFYWWGQESFVSSSKSMDFYDVVILIF